ncbi:MAG: hypothetical protein CM15mP128_1960 [Methanobacteriota archaeon]|nr:MAG: hypothetical protein CM15mP128_1960 [Euryarchaeota archaeon]
MPTRKAAVRNYLIATLALGSLFIVLEAHQWSHLIAEGFTLATSKVPSSTSPPAPTRLHVFIGLLVMLYLVFKADTVGFDERGWSGHQYFGLYWHTLLTWRGWSSSPPSICIEVIGHGRTRIQNRAVG